MTDYVLFSGTGVVHSVSRPPYDQRVISGVCGDPPVYCGGVHGPCDTWSGSTTFALTPLVADFWLAVDSSYVAPGSLVTFSGGASPSVVEGKTMPIVGDSLIWFPDHPDRPGGEATETEIHTADPAGFCMPEYLGDPYYQCRRKIRGSGTFYRSVWVNGKWAERGVHIQTASLVLEANPVAAHTGDSVTFTPSWSDGTVIAANQIAGWAWTPDTPPGATGQCAAGVLSCRRALGESGTMKVTVTRNGVTRTAMIRVVIYTEFRLDADKSTAFSGDTATFTPKVDGVPHSAARWKWVPDSTSDAVACPDGTLNCKKKMVVSGTMWAFLSSTTDQGDSASKRVELLPPPPLQLTANRSTILPGDSVMFSTSAGGAPYAIYAWRYDSEGWYNVSDCDPVAFSCTTTIPDAGYMWVFGVVAGVTDSAMVELVRAPFCGQGSMMANQAMRASMQLCLDPSPETSGTPPAVCGDQRDTIIAQYYNKKLFLPTPEIITVPMGRNWKPTCADFVSSSSTSMATAYYTYLQLSVYNTYAWSILKRGLLAPASSGHGLDKWINEMGGTPRTIASAYRSPKHNAEIVPAGRLGSRHMHGDAVDLQNPDRLLPYAQAKATWEFMIAAARRSVPGYVEPQDGPCGLACAHTDWRNFWPNDTHHRPPDP